MHLEQFDLEDLVDEVEGRRRQAISDDDFGVELLDPFAREGALGRLLGLDFASC